MSSNRRRIASQRRNKETGSRNKGEPVFIAVAKLRRPHGLHGEALVAVLTDFPERLEPGKKLLLGNKHKAVTIKSSRHHNKGLLLAFDEFATPEELGAYRNQLLFVRPEELPELEDDEYYYHQLIGMEVWEENGDSLGTLAEIIETGANDVFVVRKEGRKDLLLPGISEVLKDIDLDQRRVEVALLPGLEPEEK